MSLMNPFETEIESRLINFTTDSSFLKPSANKSEHSDGDSSLHLDIDDIAILKPAYISQAEIERSLTIHNESISNQRVQSIIHKFFTSNSIVPSPKENNNSNLLTSSKNVTSISPDSARKRIKIENSTFDITKSSKSDISIQTEISLPIDYDLNMMLAKNLMYDHKLLQHLNYLRDHQNFENSETKSLKSKDVTNLTRTLSSDSPSARKLFSPDNSKNSNLVCKNFEDTTLTGMNILSPDNNNFKYHAMNYSTYHDSTKNMTSVVPAMFSPPIENYIGFKRPQATPSSEISIKNFKSPALTPIQPLVSPGVENKENLPLSDISKFCFTLNVTCRSCLKDQTLNLDVVDLYNGREAIMKTLSNFSKYTNFICNCHSDDNVNEYQMSFLQ
ncbi:MAG: hypothetical protein MHPSP_001105 [Paramarteilia canceri]